jgi:predicted metalloprotease with PDZ domain
MCYKSGAMEALMKRLFLLALLLVPGFLSAQEAAAPPLAVSYTLDVTAPGEGSVKVEMLIENNRDDVLTLGIPVWAPGSYRVVPYHRGVKDLEAEIEGRPVEVGTTDHESLWTVKAGGAPKVKVRYALKPAQVPPLRQNLSKLHYDVQGPSAYLFVKGRLNGPHKVAFKLPEDWKVGTGLAKLKDGSFGARDYDTFIDCPTELGSFDLHTFKHEQADYQVVVHATGKYDSAKLVETCRTIVAEQMTMFGPAPFDRYVFIFHFQEQMGGGGLEHLNSTHISYPMRAVAANAASIDSITSHEFFHLWNVKRIRPAELGPFDYTQPVRSKALWLCEGVTSYYGDLTLARIGLWTRNRYFEHLAWEIGQLQNNPARLKMSVEEASRTVWDWRRDDRTPTLDYYNKGELLGLLIDLKIRTLTSNKKSFDDVMRHLHQKYVLDGIKAGQGPIGRGFEEGAILKAVNKVSGADFTKFFSDYVSGLEELPYEEVMAAAGLTLKQEKAMTLGVQFTGVRIAAVPEGSEAEKAGLRKGDRIVQIGSQEISNRAELRKALDELKNGARVKVTLTRQEVKDDKTEDVRMEAELTAAERETGAYRIGLAAEPTELQKVIVVDWLRKRS